MPLYICTYINLSVSLIGLPVELAFDCVEEVLLSVDWFECIYTNDIFPQLSINKEYKM